jgi:hypothetical protein
MDYFYNILSDLITKLQNYCIVGINWINCWILCYIFQILKNHSILIKIRWVPPFVLSGKKQYTFSYHLVNFHCKICGSTDLQKNGAHTGSVGILWALWAYTQIIYINYCFPVHYVIFGLNEYILPYIISHYSFFCSFLCHFSSCINLTVM